MNYYSYFNFYRIYWIYKGFLLSKFEYYDKIIVGDISGKSKKC